MTEVYDFMSMMAAQQDDEVLRPFDPSEVVDVKRPGGVKTTAWQNYKVLARYRRWTAKGLATSRINYHSIGHQATEKHRGRSFIRRS